MTGRTLLARVKRARERRDVDAAVALFRPDAEYRHDPFEPALNGGLAIRSWWTTSAEAETHVEFDAERVWVTGSTVLASWHGAATRQQDAARVRSRGIHDPGAGRDRTGGALREWTVARIVGVDSTFGPEPAPAGTTEEGSDGRRRLLRRRQRLRSPGARERARPGAPGARHPLRLQGRQGGHRARQGGHHPAHGLGAACPGDPGPHRVEGHPARPVAQDLRLGRPSSPPAAPPCARGSASARGCPRSSRGRSASSSGTTSPSEVADPGGRGAGHSKSQDELQRVIVRLREEGEGYSVPLQFQNYR